MVLLMLMMRVYVVWATTTTMLILMVERWKTFLPMKDLDRTLVHSAARKLKILKASGRPVLGLHAPLKNPAAGSGDPAAGHTEGN